MRRGNSLECGDLASTPAGLPGWGPRFTASVRGALSAALMRSIQIIRVVTAKGPTKASSHSKRINRSPTQSDLHACLRAQGRVGFLACALTNYFNASLGKV